MIAADVGVPVVDGAFLGQAARFADRRVEADREGRGPGSGSGGPDSPEDLPAHPVELADVAPAEAAQERAEVEAAFIADEAAVGEALASPPGPRTPGATR